jgi:hypothetical protein
MLLKKKLVIKIKEKFKIYEKHKSDINIAFDYSEAKRKVEQSKTNLENLINELTKSLNLRV